MKNCDVKSILRLIGVWTCEGLFFKMEFEINLQKTHRNLNKIAQLENNLKIENLSLKLEA